MIGFGILLACIGLALVAIEFFLPGGLLAILGIFALLGSIAVMAFCLGVAWLLGFVFLLTLVVGAVCKMALRKVKSSRKRGSYFHDQDLGGLSVDAYGLELCGKSGVVVTDLRPSGHIISEGKRYQAVSEGGYLSQGEQVVILRVEGARTIVRKG